MRSHTQVLLGFCSPHHLHSYKHGSNASIHGFWDPKMNREQTLIFYSSPAPNFDLVVGKRVSGGNAANRLLDGQDRSTHTRQCSIHTCWYSQPHLTVLTASTGQGRNPDLPLATEGTEFSEASKADPRLQSKWETTHPGNCSFWWPGSWALLQGGLWSCNFLFLWQRCPHPTSAWFVHNGREELIQVWLWLHTCGLTFAERRAYWKSTQSKHFN